MEQNVYRSELDRLRFTEQGRAELTDALMAEQAAPRRSPWVKRGMAAVLAAVLLVGTAAAVTFPLWEAYFGPMDQGQQAVVEALSGTLPAAVTSNGATMTPQAAFGGQGALYLMLEVEAPEGTVLPALEGDAVYWLSSNDDPETHRMRLETAEGREVEDLSYSIGVTCLEDGDPTDNKIALVVDVTADGDLAGLTLRIPGLWKWEIGDKSIFAPIFTGDFAFPISEDMGEESVVTLDVAGVTAQTSWGPITMETLEISPLGARWTYRIDEATAQAAQEAEQAAMEEPPAVTAVDEDGAATAARLTITPSAPLSLVLKDGTEVSVTGGFLGEEDGLQVCSGSLPAPLDLSEADHLLWGETRIPLN